MLYQMIEADEAGSMIKEKLTLFGLFVHVLHLQHAQTEARLERSEVVGK